MAPADRPWFEPLVRTFEGPALRFALMLVRDRAIAEEIVQEAFVRVWASPKTPSEEVEFRRWLFRAISNLATDHVRRQQRFARIPIWHSQPEDPTAAFDRQTHDPELAVALQRLSDRERLVIHLRYYEDLPFADVAEVLGERDATARQLASRALARLRKRLTARAVEDALA
jgi:RNA polymerase sigma-70 factor (ECF subfamily)